MEEFEFLSGDLEEFFSAVKSGKREKKLKNDVLVGESFDNLFLEKVDLHPAKKMQSFYQKHFHFLQILQEEVL